MGDRNGRCEHVAGRRLLKIFGGLAIAAIAWGVISQIHDIRRYIKISTM